MDFVDVVEARRGKNGPAQVDCFFFDPPRGAVETLKTEQNSRNFFKTRFW